MRVRETDAIRSEWLQELFLNSRKKKLEALEKSASKTPTSLENLRKQLTKAIQDQDTRFIVQVLDSINKEIFVDLENLSRSQVTELEDREWRGLFYKLLDEHRHPPPEMVNKIAGLFNNLTFASMEYSAWLRDGFVMDWTTAILSRDRIEDVRVFDKLIALWANLISKNVEARRSFFKHPLFEIIYKRSSDPELPQTSVIPLGWLYFNCLDGEKQYPEFELATTIVQRLCGYFCMELESLDQSKSTKAHLEAAWGIVYYLEGGSPLIERIEVVVNSGIIPKIMQQLLSGTLSSKYTYPLLIILEKLSSGTPEQTMAIFGKEHVVRVAD